MLCTVDRGIAIPSGSFYRQFAPGLNPGLYWILCPGAVFINDILRKLGFGSKKEKNKTTATSHFQVEYFYKMAEEG